MAIVIASLVLVLLSFIIRGRFKKKGVVNWFLQGYGVSLFLWAVFTIFVIALCCKHVMHNLSGNLFVELSLAFIASTAVILSFPVSFVMTKSPIANAYLSNRKTRDIYIEINKDFIPPDFLDSKKAERIEFIKKFTRDVISLKGIRCKNVIVMSHLITPGISRLISKALKGEGANFSCESYVLKRGEITTLNLLYGGKTRLRLLTHEKHANGFKVHRTGHKFTIRLHS